MREAYDLGLIIKDLRVKAGMSQKELGEKINRDKGIISRYESNLQTPSFEIMRDLAAIFGVSISYFAGEQNNGAISTVGLSCEQKNILAETAELFKVKQNEKSEISSRQLELIGKIAVAFALK